ncbi:MAG: hypothetical protein PHD95_06975 [Candidatus ainarchaeum sp.]|nr:hypothetical protein [Candidatus ainarchaeum sp.]
MELVEIEWIRTNRMIEELIRSLRENIPVQTRIKRIFETALVAYPKDLQILKNLEDIEAALGNTNESIKNLEDTRRTVKKLLKQMEKQ